MALGIETWLISRGIAALVILGAEISCVPANYRQSLTFACESGQNFTVHFLSGGVQINLPGQELVMIPKAFNLGERFVSEKGTLIIDDDFASLVLKGDLSFQSCMLLGQRPGRASRAKDGS